MRIATGSRDYCMVELMTSAESLLATTMRRVEVLEE